MIFDSIIDKAKDQVGFIFEDAGDSIFRIEGVGMAALVVDTVDSETHTFGGNVTDFPREGMENISDNIRPNPAVLDFDCFVSNAPVTSLVQTAENIASNLLGGANRTQAAYNQLVALWQSRQPVTVVTKYKVWDQMGIQSITMRQTPDMGDALEFSISLKQISIVSTTTVKVPAGMGIQGNQIDAKTAQKAGTTVNAGQNTSKAVSARSGLDDATKNGPPGTNRSVLAAGSKSLEHIKKLVSDYQKSFTGD